MPGTLFVTPNDRLTQVRTIETARWDLGPVYMEGGLPRLTELPD